MGTTQNEPFKVYGEITKELFVATINSLMLQRRHDIDSNLAISKVFSTDCYYNNDALIKATIGMLQTYFPKDENNFCEIEHFCFDMNFGCVGDQELISIEDLWDRLTLDAFGRWKELLNDEIEKAIKEK